MKRVVFLGAGLGGGGAEHQCAQLMNFLVDKGYDVTYASFGEDKDHYYVSPKVKRVSLAFGKSHFRKLLAIWRYLLTAPMDVEVAFSQRMSALSLFPLLLRPRIKVISSERNYTIDAPDRWERVLTKTRVYRRANHIVPNNYSQGRYLAEKYPYLARKITVITNYTDLDAYSASALPDNDRIWVGIFCRFESQKNFHRFVEAMHILKECLPETSFQVDWYGNHRFTTDHQTQYFEKGLQMMKEYGLTDTIIIKDPTREVASLIPQYDVLCLPSLHEGFSNSISEYICCGRPVICSNVSDNSVMVKEGENGFLFDPTDPSDIAAAFMRFFSLTGEMRAKMGRRSREIAEALFDKERFITAYIDLIEA